MKAINLLMVSATSLSLALLSSTCASFTPGSSNRQFIKALQSAPLQREIFENNIAASNPGDSSDVKLALSGHTSNKHAYNRRSLLSNMLKISAQSALLVTSAIPTAARGAVGTLPEFADTNAILQGVTVNVADFSQQQQMISFLEDSMDFIVLRQRRVGDVTETWLGFGPEQLSIPENFEMPVSSFAQYGGHASIRIRYDSKTSAPFYSGGETPPGDNIAYMQVGVPTYRISQMVKNGGAIIDAFGYANVISPSGLPIRAIVGINPDPMMFIAINCRDVAKSRAFYEQLGLTEQPYPFARLAMGQSPFEPPQPKNSIYLSHSKNSMGILLLPATKKRGAITPSPVLQSLDIVYTPSNTSSGEGDDLRVLDPSGVQISFTSVGKFEKEEAATRSSLIGI